MFRVVYCSVLLTFLVASVVVAHPPDRVKFVQLRLIEEGYEPGFVDGRLDGETQETIKAYQRDWQMDETGRISPELIMMLTRRHARTKPQWYEVQGMECVVWNPRPQPQATVTWSGGCENGKTNGQGERTWSYVNNGQRVFDGRYSGQDKGGKRHGKGVLTTANGYRYEGIWEDGDLRGRGVFTWPSGTRYEGEFKQGKLHGQGIFTWAKGGRYEGEFKDGKFHGHGSATYENGDRYEGTYKDGKRHGKGIYTWANGNRYEGEYASDVQHGLGTYTWASKEWKGDRYEGEWRYGKKHGWGVYTWTAGERKGDQYEGEWKEGKFDGSGIYRWSDGTKFEGKFRTGRPIGPASPVSLIGK